MPTVAEMELLNRATGDLADTFTRNRALRADVEDRRRRAKLDEAMLEERRGERADAQSTRREYLGAQASHQGRLEALQKEGNADRRLKLGLDFLSELNKNGQLTDEGIRAMEAKFSETFAPAGLGVKLFRAAPADGGSVQYDEDPVSGERTARLGKILRGSGRNPEKDFGTLTEEPDAMTGDVKRRVTRTLKKGELDRLMRGQAGEDTEGTETAITQEEAEAGGGIPAHVPDLPAGTPSPVRPATGAAEPKTYPSEAAARAAGHKSGDVVRLVLNGRPTLVRLK